LDAERLPRFIVEINFLFDFTEINSFWKSVVAMAKEGTKKDVTDGEDGKPQLCTKNANFSKSVDPLSEDHLFVPSEISSDEINSAKSVVRDEQAA
jgi:hypothetical protein